MSLFQKVMIVALLGICGCGRIVYLHRGSIAPDRFRETRGWVDPCLARQIEILPVPDTTEGGLMHLRIPLRNLTASCTSCEVLVRFYDVDGIAIEDPWGWRPVSIDAREIEYLIVTAPNDRAAGYKIVVRR